MDRIKRYMSEVSNYWFSEPDYDKDPISLDQWNKAFHFPSKGNIKFVVKPPPGVQPIADLSKIKISSSNRNKLNAFWLRLYRKPAPEEQKVPETPQVAQRRRRVTEEGAPTADLPPADARQNRVMNALQSGLGDQFAQSYQPVDGIRTDFDRVVRENYMPILQRWNRTQDTDFRPSDFAHVRYWGGAGDERRWAEAMKRGDQLLPRDQTPPPRRRPREMMTTGTRGLKERPPPGEGRIKAVKAYLVHLAKLVVGRGIDRSTYTSSTKWNDLFRSPQSEGFDIRPFGKLQMPREQVKSLKKYWVDLPNDMDSLNAISMKYVSSIDAMEKLLGYRITIKDLANEENRPYRDVVFYKIWKNGFKEQFDQSLVSGKMNKQLRFTFSKQNILSSTERFLQQVGTSGNRDHDISLTIEIILNRIREVSPQYVGDDLMRIVVDAQEGRKKQGAQLQPLINRLQELVEWVTGEEGKTYEGPDKQKLLQAYNAQIKEGQHLTAEIMKLRGGQRLRIPNITFFNKFESELEGYMREADIPKDIGWFREETGHGRSETWPEVGLKFAKKYFADHNYEEVNARIMFADFMKTHSTAFSKSKDRWDRFNRVVITPLFKELGLARKVKRFTKKSAMIQPIRPKDRRILLKFSDDNRIELNREAGLWRVRKPGTPPPDEGRLEKTKVLKKWILGKHGLTDKYENIDAIYERLPAEVKSRFPTIREFRNQMRKTKQIKNTYIERQHKEKKNDPMFYRLKEVQLQPEVTKAWILENLTTTFISTQDLFAAVPPNIKAVLAIPRRGQPAATQALRDKKARDQFMRILKDTEAAVENLKTEKKGYHKFWRLEPEADEAEAEEEGDDEASVPMSADEEPRPTDRIMIGEPPSPREVRGRKTRTRRDSIPAEVQSIAPEDDPREPRPIAPTIVVEDDEELAEFLEAERKRRDEYTSGSETDRAESDSDSYRSGISFQDGHHRVDPHRRRPHNRPFQSDTSSSTSSESERWRQLREDNAFEILKQQNKSAAVRAVFDRGDERNFWKWNDHVGRLERVENRRVRHLNNGIRRGMQEISVLKPHPMYSRVQEQLLQKSEREQPLGSVHGGKPAMIGDSIQLKLLPATIYIHIDKKCPRAALQILCQRIVEHSKAAPTRILVKHGRKGKFSYRVWISTTVMKGMTDALFCEKLLILTKDGLRAQTLVLRQHIRRAHMHELLDRNNSLL